MVVMAEDFDKRHKQSKVFNNNPSLQINAHNQDDLTTQGGRKKVRSPKGSGKMNPLGLSSSHQSASSSNTSSKTVAAILKQQKDFKVGENMSAPRSQHLQQFQRKGLGHKNSSSSSGLQDNLTFGKPVNSPKSLGHGGSSTPANISPAMSPSNAQVVSPSGREPNHSATTKSSSLSRELSPSRITAQIVKVMADTSQSSTQNLLLSVLQGNMPDPMGILNSSKSDPSSSSIGVSPVSVSNHTLPSTPRISPLGKNNSSTSTLSSQLNTNTFISPSSLYESSGIFPNQSSNLEERVSPNDAFSSLQQVHGTSVNNLMTASAGSVQTVNVSHIPKTTNIPMGMNPGGSLSSGQSLPSSSPRHSPRSAMEVAQQIKLEANGQSASAKRVAMQQQLRSQIKGSRSLDAQLASSRQNAGGNVPTGPSDQQQHFNSSHQILPIKEMEQQKTLEASMPLLASKLSSVPSSPNVNSNPGLMQLNSKPKQNLPLTASLLKSPLPTSTNPSTLNSFPVVNPSSALSSPLSIRKSVHQSLSSQSKPVHTPDSKQHRQQQQQQLQKQFQQPQQPSPSLSSSSVPSSLESTAITNESSWQQQTQKNSSFLSMSIASSSSVGMVGLHEPPNKQPMLQRLIQASDSSSVSDHTVQTDMVLKAEGQVQTNNPTMSKQLRVGITNSTNVSSFLGLNSSPNKGKMSQSIQAVGIGGLGQNLHSSSIPVSSIIEKRRKSGPGESKQTAIDVDMDFGNLPSIAGDDQRNAITNISHNIKFSPVSQGGIEGIPLLLGKDIANVFPQQQQQHDLGLSNATFVKDITGVSNPSGSSGDLSSFLPIHTSASPLQTNVSKTSRGLPVQSSQLLMTSQPISYPYPSTAATTVTPSSVAVTNYLNPSDFTNPPPPYPSNKSPLHYHQQNQNAILLQQQQSQIQQPQQQQSLTTKSSVKHTMRNPFTFPTTGVKVQTGHDSSGLWSYTINPQPMEPSTGKKPVKNEVSVTSSIKERQHGLKGKSQSDISYLASLNSESWSEDTKMNMPRLVPQVTAKLEDKSRNFGTVIKSEDNETTEEQSMVQPFNQRVANLSCLPVTNTVYRASYRTHAIAVQRARSGVITNTAKTLDVLRQNIQRSINKEISDIIKKYTSKFFEPALANIRQNSNEDLLGNEHLNYVCRQILEEAKSEYSSSLGRRSVTPTTDIFDNISDSGSASGRRAHNTKRSRISDSDSEKGSEAGSVRRTIKRKGRPPVQGSGRVTPSKTLKAGDLVRKEGPKWDPDRMKPETLFIMGAKANKALGLGNTRGRLYIRHPDVFKYVGDSEDKLWLCERGLMPPTGGKAYLMLVEDIEDLSKSDDYRDSPCLLMHECKGFTVPEWMLVKMKEQMRVQRTDGHRKSQSNCDTEPSSTDSRPKTLPFSTFTNVSVKVETQPSPADTEDMEFLSSLDVDVTSRPSSTISPFNMSGRFEEAGGGSLSPAELDTMDDRPPIPSIFT